MADKGLLAQIMDDPMAFGVISGIIVGLYAVVRDKEVTPFAAYVTAGVGAVGEAALIWSDPNRPDLLTFGLKSAAGMMIGMAPFVSWGGEQSILQRAGTALAPKPAETVVTSQ